MYVCMYVCMYVYMCLCVCVYAHSRLNQNRVCRSYLKLNSGKRCYN